MRDYRVVKSSHKHGETFVHGGKEYKRAYIGGAIFDHEINSKKLIGEWNKMSALYRKNKKAYYKKYAEV